MRDICYNGACSTGPIYKQKQKTSADVFFLSRKIFFMMITWKKDVAVKRAD